MGMMALAGAIGGAGRGIEKNVEHNREVDMKALEEAREMRIRQFEAEQASTRQDKGFKHEESMQGSAQEFAGSQQDKGFKHEESMQGGTFGQQDKLQKGTQDFTTAENAKERASREKIAKERADATAAAARGSQLGKRWESKVVKQTTYDSRGLPTGDTEALSVFDKNSARTYLQDGDKFYPQGAPKTRKVPGPDGKTSEQPIRSAARSEIDKLIQNPDQADNFVRTYGYLPYEFFNGLGNNAGAYDAGAAAAPGTGDDDEE